jgi:hypothetical protein
LVGVDFNAKQIERVYHLYAGTLEEKELEIIESRISKTLISKEKEALNYVMIDRTIYPTRGKRGTLGRG